MPVAAEGSYPEERIRERARQYAPRLRPGQYFCETTALALLGVSLPFRADDDMVHVGVTSPRRAPRTRGVVGHESAMPTVTTVSGLPVRIGTEAWAEAAARLSPRDLILIGDGLVRRKGPIAERDELAKTVQRWRGKRGFRRLWAAEARVRAGTDSIKETELRLLIVDSGFPEPLVNARLFDRSGRKVGFGDLLYREYRVLVEYDGGYHFASDQQVKDDIDRLAMLADAGYAVVRVQKLHLLDPHSSLERIRDALTAAGWTDPSQDARTRRG